MLLLLLLALAGCAGAARRLSLDACAPAVYILAQGAPCARGRVFAWPPPRRYVSALQDATGAGTRLLARVPACQRADAVSVRGEGDGLASAVRWLEGECERADCVVYTELALGISVNFHIVS